MYRSECLVTTVYIRAWRFCFRPSERFVNVELYHVLLIRCFRSLFALICDPFRKSLALVYKTNISISPWGIIFDFVGSKDTLIQLNFVSWQILKRVVIWGHSKKSSNVINTSLRHQPKQKQMIKWKSKAPAWVRLWPAARPMVVLTRSREKARRSMRSLCTGRGRSSAYSRYEFLQTHTITQRLINFLFETRAVNNKNRYICVP